MAISAGAGAAELAGWARGLAAVDLLLLREPLDGEALAGAARLVRAAAPPGARVLVAGGRVDVALAAELAGVHLRSGAGELRVDEVRRLLPAAWVSVSCHSLEEVHRAAGQGASSVVFAPVFGKVVAGRTVAAGVGLSALEAACRAAEGVPVLALGGVTAANMADCLAAGAAGVAGIRMFAQAGSSEQG